ncbi:MAG: type II toxin-antitoxin system RelE/ParE family toxin [Chitinophagaceae bacterium]|nr:type II toxin-antitoxin system RelE/ParE family toxin [Chitinophagaceae bacterium]
MALEVRWTKKALNDFNHIQDYLQFTWGDLSVRKFTKKVFNFLDLLSVFPYMGTMENKDLNIRGFVITEQVTLFYQVRYHQIILMRFYDNRQDPKSKKYK